MPRLRSPRLGEAVTTNGIVVPFSFWPAKAGKRWKLQRRLYVKDPWATLFGAVYRSSASKARVREALSYLDQAEHDRQTLPSRELIDFAPHIELGALWRANGLVDIAGWLVPVAVRPLLDHRTPDCVLDFIAGGCPFCDGQEGIAEDIIAVVSASGLGSSELLCEYV